MANKIHSTAIINNKAIIEDDVEIGPYCIIDENVKINNGTKLKSHIVVEGDTEIGKNNIIYPFVTIGVAPQDLKFKGEKSKTIIGDNNTIREHVTIHRGTQDGKMLTKIGNNCLLMVGAHIAHDCHLANNIILANNATLAGHVTIDDNVIIGGLSALHQFVRVGKGAMIGGMSGIENDVIPYGLAMGERASLAGLNLVGLKRAKYDRQDILDLRAFFKDLYSNNSQSLNERVKILGTKYNNPLTQNICQFILRESDRSFLPYKK